MPSTRKINFYGLSTCPHCRHAKEYLESKKLDFKCVYVDQLQGQERDETVKRVRELNPRCSFPTMVFFDDEEDDANAAVVVGFKADEIDKALQ